MFYNNVINIQRVIVIKCLSLLEYTTKTRHSSGKLETTDNCGISRSGSKFDGTALGISLKRPELNYLALGSTFK